MKIKLRGVRGSIPTTDPETSFYGGNTSCVDVREDGWMLILDGGSGIARLQLNGEINHKRIDVLLTHLHLDHILGLGFFTPLFDSSMEVHIWGPASSATSLQSRLGRYLSPPLFPVMLRELQCKLHLHEIENSEFEIGPFRITSQFVIHPGPTVGYRIQGAKSVFTYMPDHEPALGGHGIIKDKRWVSGIDLASGADVLYHDAQYTRDEYPSKVGWGHSSMHDAAAFGDLAGVGQLLLAHHDPMRTDDQLNKIHKELMDTTGYGFAVSVAREGSEFTL